ncbi:acyl carrier protein [Sphingobacterium sp. SRCM116780]|uniref:acyl carrier protein n=1 Tax=Sphingobacterium sp. SRCM116780 TaxID=2907623 RepID=UPI001F3DBA9D|nr:acyl carrier protein [Sphingobacterium sp. SRCM116780]UIR55964.1 acyl carrier protein [Sphingobacterium sp. SRCM116780]
MKAEIFLELLVEDLELQNPLTLASNLKELDEWDSMTAMLLIGVVSNEFGKTLTAEDIKELTTVQSLVDKIGVQHFS